MTVETTTGERVPGAEVLRYLNRANAVVIWFSPLLAGLMSLHMGKSMAWDLLHYHYYNGYAFLTDRLDFDILPAVFHTFLNPALDVVFYAAVETLPPRAVGFALGAIHGINIILLFQCARLVLTRWGADAAGPAPNLLPAFLAVTGFGTAAAMGTLGSWHHDLIASLFFLGALLVLLRQGNRLTLRRAAAAGSVGGGWLGSEADAGALCRSHRDGSAGGAGVIPRPARRLCRGRPGGGSGVADFGRVLDGADVRGVRQSVLPVLQPAVLVAFRRRGRWPRSALSARKSVGVADLSRDLQFRRRPDIGGAVA
jgi:hypothetical protein